ncbi:uncharacterized protein K489DRAFT_377603 [Dissoconium aciculare CBS 342.82]|uniref:Uncharacterized protein n=1 Tax=Dissoconium aciculare CBS 342.82 TaxID=1314786 RepID=A0A6J3MDY4_9PEZI|nr:uncharacterized protein K489DRAFT_377603 [Dissoconium aciculare CBS 342.82]KAF1825062.1 hypothetical protein K489DRAFT_377603 [Dissoconium aciculare CBS 342.82]
MWPRICPLCPLSHPLSRACPVVPVQSSPPAGGGPKGKQQAARHHPFPLPSSLFPLSALSHACLCSPRAPTPVFPSQTDRPPFLVLAFFLPLPINSLPVPAVRLTLCLFRRFFFSIPSACRRPPSIQFYPKSPHPPAGRLFAFWPFPAGAVIHLHLLLSAITNHLFTRSHFAYITNTTLIFVFQHIIAIAYPTRF